VPTANKAARSLNGAPQAASSDSRAGGAFILTLTLPWATPTVEFHFFPKSAKRCLDLPGTIRRASFPERKPLKLRCLRMAPVALTSGG
jgi:hypothetical protein